MSRPALTVSVVIPALNESATLGSVLEAVLSQERPRGVELEVVVVDDGSQDSTAACARNFDGVLVIESDHLGPAGARNLGARQASDGVLVFLDSDGGPMGGWLRQIGEAFADDRVGFATWPARVTDVSAGPGHTTTWYPDRHGPHGVLVLPGCFAVPHSVFDDIDGYDPALRFGENSDLCRRAQARCAELGLETARLREVTMEVHLGKPAAHYDAHRLAAIEHLLARDANEYATDPNRRSRAHSIAAVNAGRCGDWRLARRHARAAVAARPSDWRGFGRVILAYIPPLGRRLWAAEGRRSRIDGS